MLVTPEDFFFLFDVFDSALLSLLPFFLFVLARKKLTHVEEMDGMDADAWIDS